MAGKKRSCDEFRERSELGSKRVKMRDLESVLHSERIYSHYPKSSENREDSDPSLSVDEEKSQVTKDTITMNSDVGQAERTGKDTLPLQVDTAPRPLGLHAKVCVTNTSACGDAQCANKLSSFGKHGIEHNANFVTPRGFGWDVNAKDLSSSLNQDPFYPHRSEHLKARDVSECGSTTGPSEDSDAMRVWKEMKQSGFLSSSRGGVPVPKPRGRKSKKKEFKKKMKIPKIEQVDRFARTAAPSGLLNELNPGIINHVRNRVQVHSKIAALVRSQKLENHNGGSKQGIQMKSGTKDISEEKNDLENVNGFGMNRPHLSPEDFITLSRSRQTKYCSISKSESAYLNSEGAVGDGDSSMVESRIIGKYFCPSHSNPDNEDDILAGKLSSSTSIFSDITSSSSNEESANPTTTNSLSVKSATVAYQWLELLYRDIKERLAALRCSKKRVQEVIHTQLSCLILTEFSSNQENDLCVMKNSHARCSDNATADVHRARWSFLFDQMDKALSEEEKQLESWLIQVKEMQLHCERGLQRFQYNDATHD
ncbi:uncharacterized protein LOC132312477 isoform X2 [Cornus florida]|uniref:uncharacterized protein LOC132312477 isoform X2 n=1 Tax=Cornus florida TaxID=4283 RepID=UPI002899E621|nr:uncharacterized protein LOC132312477 isoform X2 [Cornus florida]